MHTVLSVRIELVLYISMKEQAVDFKFGSVHPT